MFANAQLENESINEDLVKVFEAKMKVLEKKMKKLEGVVTPLSLKKKIENESNKENSFLSSKRKLENVYDSPSNPKKKSSNNLAASLSPNVSRNISPFGSPTKSLPSASPHDQMQSSPNASPNKVSPAEPSSLNASNVTSEKRRGLGSFLMIRCETCLYLNSVLTSQFQSATEDRQSMFDINARCALDTYCNQGWDETKDLLQHKVNKIPEVIKRPGMLEDIRDFLCTLVSESTRSNLL
ncbi:hypothetical protein HCN44_010376 [Aphidius gifuensis]|uniref:Uncharacterized protein n=1 Tax=Aphidius gifuensis TaxID=684658 RepID=A0A834XYW6_APHGI|nr:hypothetical protein HCN44_010376 [Aphidius gifuensis]